MEQGERRSTTWRLVRIAIPTAALLFLVIAARDSFLAIAEDPGRVRWSWIAAALGLNLVYRVANGANLSRVVAALGYSLGARGALRVWVRSELLRWLPGGVWGYLSRVRRLQGEGLPGAASAAAVSLEILLTLAAWVTVAAAGVIVSGMVAEWAGHVGGIRSLFLGGTVVSVGGLLALRMAWPRIRSRWAPLAEVRLKFGRTLLAYLNYVALNAVRGLGLACVLMAVASTQPPLPATVGANAIAWLVGFLVVFAPGGLGVREAGIALLLSPWLSLEQGALAALLWRATQLGEELLLLPFAFGERRPLPARSPRSATGGRALLSWIAWLSLVGFTTLFVLVIMVPGWKQPISRSFDERFGFGRLVRAAEGSFELRSAKVEVRRFKTRYLGEGRILSDTILVPIVPMTIVDEVRVDEGQAVEAGALLLSLDDAHARVRFEAAEAVVGKAQAELSRRLAGSHHTQMLERPELDRMNLEHRQREKELKDELLAHYQELESEGLVSRAHLVNLLLEATQASREARTAEIILQGSEEGRTHTLTVAEMSLREARAALRQREIELAEHQVLAPIDGVVREVLVRAGEFNRNTGRTGVVLSAGTWFEARLGQTALAGVTEGAPCVVHLEALPGVELRGTLARIVPFVDNDIGGPETSRPIRPRGTGAPEWPSTFRVRVELEPVGDVQLVPGLTGHVAVTIEANALGIPESALDALSPAQGLVFRVEGDIESPPIEPEPGVVRATDRGRWVRWKPRRVLTGRRSDGWVEVLEGLDEGTEVLLGGHGVLRETDFVRVIEPRSER